MSDYKGIHGYETRNEQMEAWQQHLDQMPHEERKTVVIQILRKDPFRSTRERSEFWPQLLPALDELVSAGKVRARHVPARIEYTEVLEED